MQIKLSTWNNENTIIDEWMEEIGFPAQFEPGDSCYFAKEGRVEIKIVTLDEVATDYDVQEQTAVRKIWKAGEKPVRVVHIGYTFHIYDDWTDSSSCSDEEEEDLYSDAASSD